MTWCLAIAALAAMSFAAPCACIVSFHFPNRLHAFKGSCSFLLRLRAENLLLFIASFRIYVWLRLLLPGIISHTATDTHRKKLFMNTKKKFQERAEKSRTVMQ